MSKFVISLVSPKVTQNPLLAVRCLFSLLIQWLIISLFSSKVREGLSIITMQLPPDPNQVLPSLASKSPKKAGPPDLISVSWAHRK